MRLPHLNAAAKGQILGMGLGLAAALWTTDQFGLPLVPFFAGWIMTCSVGKR